MLDSSPSDASDLLDDLQPHAGCASVSRLFREGGRRDGLCWAVGPSSASLGSKRKREEELWSAFLGLQEAQDMMSQDHHRETEALRNEGASAFSPG